MRSLASLLVVVSACSFSGAPTAVETADAATDGDVAPVADASPDAPAADAAPPVNVYRINVAGPSFEGIDRIGTWAADDGGEFCFGAIDTILSDVQNTLDDPLFQRMRFGGDNEDIGCDLDLAPGDYLLVLHLAELFRGPGCPGQDQRDYTITLEGAVVDRFDVVADNGGCVADPNTPTAAPVSKSYPVTITDGQLTLRAGMPADRGLLQAVEVFRVLPVR